MPSSKLLVLPSVSFGSSQLRLPLCDSTAMALARAIVEDNQEQRARQLAAVFAFDPSLVIWAKSQSAVHAQAFDRIPLLANWLASRLDLLTWPQEPFATEFSSQQQSRFAALVAESVGVALEATRGFSTDLAVLQPACFSALISHWREWLEAANPNQSLLLSGPMAGWPESFVGGEVALSADARAMADEAWRRWLTEVPGIQAVLPPLAHQMRQLRELQSNFAAALQTAKLDAMKEFAYGAGHELNNPLANIASRAQTLLIDERDPERRRRLAGINTQAFRAHEMLADMMLFSRPPQPQFKQVDVVRLVDEVLAELAEEAAAQATTLQRIRDADSVIIEADSKQLRVAVRALCINSLEALGRGGRMTLEVRSAECGVTSGFRTPHSELRTPNSIDVIIADDGPGIVPEIRDKIFDPFFSGREAGRGLGFGLSKCWRIVALHGGKIEVESESPHGAKFIVTLPTRQNTNRR